MTEAAVAGRYYVDYNPRRSRSMQDVDSSALDKNELQIMRLMPSSA